VEVHDQAELETALEAGAGVIGINNRDLRTFQTDLTTTAALAPLVPDEVVLVSESGIHDAAQLRLLRRWRVDAALIGESLVTAPDPGARLRALLAAEEEVVGAGPVWLRNGRHDAGAAGPLPRPAGQAEGGAAGAPPGPAGLRLKEQGRWKRTGRR